MRRACDQCCSQESRSYSLIPNRSTASSTPGPSPSRGRLHVVPGPGATVAPRGYNRWLIPPAALAVHLCIGEIYAFSVFKVPLKDHFDTKLTPIGIIFSIAIAMLGLSAAFGGRWVERVGPRKAMALAATCWGSGFLIGAVGVATTQLWIVYLGIGFIGGIGLGIGYISPVSTLSSGSPTGLAWRPAWRSWASAAAR